MFYFFLRISVSPWFKFDLLKRRRLAALPPVGVALVLVVFIVQQRAFLAIRIALRLPHDVRQRQPQKSG